MKLIHDIKIFAGTLLCFTLFSQISTGQIFSFKNYGAEFNIPDGFIYTINQSNDGYLWVGTGSGLARFDGYNFYKIQYPDSSQLRITTSSLKDKNGTLWFGCTDGNVYHSIQNRLVQVKLPNEKAISDLAEGPDGLIYVIPQGKAIFSINPARTDEIHQYSIPGDPIMESAAFAAGNKILIGTQENLLICRPGKESIELEGAVEGFDYSAITSIIAAGDSSDFIIGTDGNGLFKLHLSGNGNGNSLSRFSNHPELVNLSILSITRDSENSWWISTNGSGVLQLTFSDNYDAIKSSRTYNNSSGLIIDNVKTVFQDIEGNFWIGTFGAGISMLTSYAYGYYMPGDNSVRNNILYVNSFKDKYILGTPAGFHLFDASAGKSVSYTDLTSVVGKNEITSYLLDSDYNLWIGTGGGGLYLRNSSGSTRRFYRSGDSGSDFIKDIEINNQDIWLATTNGVIILDKNRGNEKHRFDINSGLPHNSINKILVGKDGNVYIGTESDRLFSIDKDFNIVQGNSVMYGSTINKILSFAQSTDGELWAATKSNGVFRFLNDSIHAINRSNDLMSNYCYSILADAENDIWIGHEKGFSRFNPVKGTMRIYGNDFIKSGVFNPGGMFESADHKIFMGTTDGLIIYDRMKERKGETAPFTNINSITINDVKYDYQPSFSLPYNKKYIVRVEYVGINFSNPGKVYYSTYLENFDSDWSKLTTSREIPYSLRDGKYKFNLLAVNEEGVSQESAVSFDIMIKQPFWRTWWFIFLAFSVLTASVILIIRYREKAQKKIQEYLEKELEARTSVVVKQKAELELQNIEITDSINYAKRIQSSILPDVNKLKESFTDAFILFQPRDIVSGDFYWFDKLDDDKFIIVCADSTGHGVPGAFMSMIGSTLLQDIIARKRITQPSEILRLLDRQIFSTLNQNIEFGVANDGMDMVVCEINIKTRHLRFASAMRPVILILDGESYYLKGNRSSIGGESVNEKYFDDQEYYLKENDSIYLFSDGLSDQFGGPDGKKMKIARLKRMIEQYSDLPMDDQKNSLLNFYAEWKGNFDQVDDILLMGVKL
jgi:ligand-binding sensor domain-containing protein/serine phosphatase RsbU (regulator of sigma subunit)